MGSQIICPSCEVLSALIGSSFKGPQQNQCMNTSHSRKGMLLPVEKSLPCFKIMLQS